MFYLIFNFRKNCNFCQKFQAEMVDNKGLNSEEDVALNVTQTSIVHGLENKAK